MNAPETRLHDEATKIAADAAAAERVRPTHVGDVVSYLSCCSDTFGHLAAIFGSIERQAEDQSASEIVKLAQAGFYIADDFENETDAWREKIAKDGVIGRADALIPGANEQPMPVADVVGKFNMSADASEQLAALFDAIAHEAQRAEVTIPLAALAKAGRYIAFDAENRAGCCADEIETNGVRSD